MEGQRGSVQDTYNPAFLHKLKKTDIPTCHILGVEVAAIDMEWLVRYVTDHLPQLSGDYICVSNVHTIVTAFEDPEYNRIQNGGILAIPDGGPLSSLGRRRGFPDMKRTTGPDFMGEIFRLSAEKGYRHYFYGSAEETLDKLRETLQALYSGIQIAGTYSPPFRPLTADEEAEIRKRINKTNADFIWVGLGAPKQEQWMARQQGKIHGLMIGVGAGFDYFAGNIKRAPEWMQKRNLEWLYRLSQEPTRLLKRYLYTNTKFIWEAYILGK